MCRCASVFNPAMFCETVRMFMVAMGSMDRSASVLAFRRCSAIPNSNSGSATGRAQWTYGKGCNFCRPSVSSRPCYISVGR